jgi:hypothetical protein
MGLALLWIWFRSQTTVSRPSRRCSEARNATTSSAWALGQQLLQLAQVLVGQGGRPAGVGPGVKSGGLSGQADPAGQGLGVDAQDARHVAAGLAPGDQRHGAAATAFQLSGSSKRSTHTWLDASARRRER